MKKRNVILVGLLSLSLLTGCTTNKIERSQQDINQEKVKKAKKEIANENKREKASSTAINEPNTSETERTQESNPNEYTQLERSEETTITPNKTGSHQYANCCTCESCVAETNRLQEDYKNGQNKENTNTDYTTRDQQCYPISFAPAWWRECNSNGHKVGQGLNTQNGKYCWRCIDCNKEVGYEICKEHNTPATPEHMQLHLK